VRRRQKEERQQHHKYSTRVATLFDVCSFGYNASLIGGLLGPNCVHLRSTPLRLATIVVLSNRVFGSVQMTKNCICVQQKGIGFSFLRA